jgi:hypothetical protein
MNSARIFVVVNPSPERCIVAVVCDLCPCVSVSVSVRVCDLCVCACVCGDGGVTVWRLLLVMPSHLPHVRLNGCVC